MRPFETEDRASEVKSWRRVAGIVEVVLELDRPTRAAYLETLGHQDRDGDLRRRVLTILLSMGAIQLADAPTEGALPSARPVAEDRIGPWRIVRVLGRGGMGVVFLAERSDDEYERQVAIKVIGSETGAPVAYQRFLSERQILAGFDHANIGKLFDAGTNREGRPYLVMEYIDGLPIDEYCFENELGVTERLELFKKVCAAVSYAHRNLVVHRDLKPSNILVTAEGEPKLLDFGIAKLLDPENFPVELEQTRTAHRPMTPNWASPEQLNREPISTSTDVYSLGLVLYKMLTGTLPSRGLQALAEDSGELSDRPSRLLAKSSGDEMAAWSAEKKPHAIRRLRGDLDNIVMKALRTEPPRRYPSVESFSDDLERFLDGRPVSATRDTPVYLFRKLAVRYRWQLTAAAIFVLAILSVAGVALYQAEQVRRERDQTVIARENAERQAILAEKQAKRAEGSLQFLSDLLRAADETERRQQDLSVRDLLVEGLDRLESGEVTAPEAKLDLLDLIGSAFRDFRDFESAVKARRLAYETALESGVPEEESIRLLGSLALLQIATGDQGDIRASCQKIVQSTIRVESRLSCLRVLSALATAEGDLRQAAALARPTIDEVARRQNPADLTALTDLAALMTFGLLESEEMRPLLWQVARAVVHEVSLESRDSTLRSLSSAFMNTLSQQGDLPALRSVVAWVEADNKSIHRHDFIAANRLLPLVWSYRRLGRYDDAMAKVAIIDEIARRVVALDPTHLHGRWLLARADGLRGRIWRDQGVEDRALADFEQAAERFRALGEESGDNFYIQRGLATALLEAGYADEARPHVHDLIEKGVRWPYFLELAEELGLLPDPMPPAIEVDVSIPPALQARLDAARHVKLPWELPPFTEPEDLPGAASPPDPASGGM